jgi:hypothetical protein
MIGLLFISLTCSKPIIENRTNLLWNNNDQKALKSATKRCKVHFPELPCLKKFSKVKFNTYYATCGK